MWTICEVYSRRYSTREIYRKNSIKTKVLTFQKQLLKWFLFIFYYFKSRKSIYICCVLRHHFVCVLSLLCTSMLLCPFFCGFQKCSAIIRVLCANVSLKWILCNFFFKKTLKSKKKKASKQQQTNAPGFGVAIRFFSVVNTMRRKQKKKELKWMWQPWFKLRKDRNSKINKKKKNSGARETFVDFELWTPTVA